MVAAMPLQNDARPSEKTVTLRDLRRVAFGLSAAIMIVMIAGAINDDSGSSTATAELGEEKVVNYVFSIDAGQSSAIAENTAASQTAHTTVITDGPATGCSIASGNSDVDSDGTNAFAISATCVITVADADDMNYESTNSWTLTLLASDDSGASDVETVTITLTDVDEFDASAPSDSNGGTNTVAENAANAATVGVTASSTDADGTTNTIAYSATANSCTDDDGHAAFAVHASTGVVTVNDNAALNYEDATSCTITVRATSQDTSTADTTFSVAITDIDEFDVGNPADTNNADNTVAENAAADATVGLTAATSDADGSTNTITYTVSAQSCSGAFAVGSSSGIVTATGSGLNYESATSCTVTILATSADSSTGSTQFTIAVTDVDEFDVSTPSDSNGATNTVAENAANAATVGVTASSSDADGSTNGITYSATANSCTDGDGHAAFAVDGNTGVVTVNDNAALNYEAAQTCTITVRATSQDSSTADTTFSVAVTDHDEFDVGAPSDADADANTLAEDVANGASAEITASSSDADGTTNTITYSVTDQSCASVFAVGSSTGVVTVADNTNVNYEVATSCTVEITATSADSSTAATTFTVTLTDVDESDVTAPADSNNAANTVAENSAATTTVGLTASATDADGTTNTVAYAITAQSCSGVFAVHSSTGVVTVTDNTNLNYEVAQSCTVTISATSQDSSTASTQFTVAVSDVNIDITAGQSANIAETSSVSSAVMTVTVSGDSDNNDFAITAGNTGTAFAINAASGAITTAATLDFETLASYTLTISVSDGTNSATTETVSITVTDGGVTIPNGQTANVAENAANGDQVMTVTTSGDSPTL